MKTAVASKSKLIIPAFLRTLAYCGFVVVLDVLAFIVLAFVAAGLFFAASAVIPIGF